MNIFLTGASSGIGKALAHEFASKGASLGLVARRRDKLEELIASLPHPELHTAIVCDVCDREAVIKAAKEYDEACGGVDVVIANAGISLGVKTRYYEDLEQFDKVFATNVIAMANTFHPFLERMAERKRGKLVGIGSVAGIRGLPGSEAYCASKSAVITYCESLRVEMQKFGVRVLTISPGFVRTPLTAHNPYKMPFIMEPEDFAREAVKTILSDKTYVTIPWQMGWLGKLLRILPNPVFDRILAKRKQKPRAGTK
jgi:short-subunit dehydrogenase